MRRKHFSASRYAFGHPSRLLTSAMPTFTGRVADAYALLEEVLSKDATGGFIFGRGLRASYASEIKVRMGRAQEAVVLAEQALALSRQYGERGHEACALRCSAEICAQQDQTQPAKDLYR